MQLPNTLKMTSKYDANCIDTAERSSARAVELAMGSARALACCFRRPRRKIRDADYSPIGASLRAAGPLPGEGAGHNTRGRVRYPIIFVLQA